MTNNDGSDRRQDRAFPGAVQWSLGAASGHVSEILWQCEALRAGRLYQRTLFATREEAEQFAERMREHEPDQRFSVEAIKASSVWN